MNWHIASSLTAARTAMATVAYWSRRAVRATLGRDLVEEWRGAKHGSAERRRVDRHDAPTRRRLRAVVQPQRAPQWPHEGVAGGMGGRATTGASDEAAPVPSCGRLACTTSARMGECSLLEHLRKAPRGSWLTSNGRVNGSTDDNPQCEAVANGEAIQLHGDGARLDASGIHGPVTHPAMRCGTRAQGSGGR